MKLLVTGDWHYRSQNPVARLDEFQATLDGKIAEVFTLARDYDCEAVIVPGDLTDSPNLAVSTLTRLENMIRGQHVPVYSVPGNHDEFASNLASLERTTYGHLAATGVIRDRMALWSAAAPIALEGHGFSTETDSVIDDYLPSPGGAADTTDRVSVVVAHGMLLERAPGFELKHTLLEDVAKHPDCPGVLICGHEHLGFGVKRLPRAKGGELVAINPGALVRLSAHPGEIERMPQVCLLEVYPGTAPACCVCGKPLPPGSASWLENSEEYIAICPECDYSTVVRYAEYGPPELWSIGHPVIETTLIPLSCARPGHEVLSREHIEAAADREAKMGQFLDLLANEGEAKFLDIQSMVEAIAKSDNLPDEVVKETLRRIAKAREALGGRREA